MSGGSFPKSPHQPDIYPLDCLVMGNVSSVKSGDDDTDRRALHFWGCSRDARVFKDNTQLCFLDYYEPTSSTSHGAPDNPIYHDMRLQYLGVRLVEIEKIVHYFRLHFEFKTMASDKMSFTTSGGKYRPVLSRWPSSDWYFLFPRGLEGTASEAIRKDVWNAWSPAA